MVKRFQTIQNIEVSGTVNYNTFTRLRNEYNKTETKKKIAPTIRRPRVIKKITTFFASRFNTAKVVENTIINPLNLRIENFKNNELSSMKG